MIGPRSMTVCDWAFIAALQVGLIALAALALWLDARLHALSSPLAGSR